MPPSTNSSNSVDSDNPGSGGRSSVRAEDLAADLLDHFEAKDRAREEAYRLCRSAVRSCSRSIRSVHRGEFLTAEKHMDDAWKSISRARETLEKHPDIMHTGFFDDAEQEYAEARAVYSLVTEHIIPIPREVGVDPVNYLCGLGDASGELRRHILDLIRAGRPEEGDFFLSQMEGIYHLLMLFDYPEAIGRGLRRKSDLARSMLEKTRGDLANAVGRSRLEEQLRGVEDKLKGSDQKG